MISTHKKKKAKPAIETKGKLMRKGECSNVQCLLDYHARPGEEEVIDVQPNREIGLFQI